ncbi:hypothetical protein PoB_002095600 [Plakobranchus ocellatus]|uniref:Uncharacterized protein n=1 Tax=Plakobranchus ocellatus TaxID=259542 RepID=A0AAV3ZIK0_9GAST|nr:hypothetical protein PoB_002095600 [Plakobranchus ocellatus]
MRVEDTISQNQAEAMALEKEGKIKKLNSEMKVKNDVIRCLSLDINLMNAEVHDTPYEWLQIESFIQRYSPKTSYFTNATSSSEENVFQTTISKTTSPTAPHSNDPSLHLLATSTLKEPFQKQYSSRFGFFDKALSIVNHHLVCTLGLPKPAPEELAHIDVIQSRVVQVQELVASLEERLSFATKDRDDALAILLPYTQQKFTSAVAGVRRYLLQEQKHKFSLLKDIDRLSRKLRGMTTPKPYSGLYALRQSAVTGKHC